MLLRNPMSFLMLDSNYNFRDLNPHDVVFPHHECSRLHIGPPPHPTMSVLASKLWQTNAESTMLIAMYTTE